MEKPHLQNQLQEAKLIAVIRSADKHKAKQQIERIIKKALRPLR